MSDPEETTEQANRGEHERDQRAYQSDRLADKTTRVEKAAEVEAARSERAVVVEQERVAKATELEAVAREKARAHRRIAFAQLGAYLLILVVCIVGWQQLQQTDDHICESAEQNREAVRNVVLAIEELGTELVVGGTDPNSPTPEQQAALDRFEAFKNEQLALLEDPPCE